MSSARFLDTSFLIDLMDEREDALSVHEEIAGAEVTGTICLYELAKFADFDPGDLLAGKEILALSPDDASEAGSVHRALHEAGDPIGEVDCLIAGIVRNRGLTIVTRDEDFRKVPELDTRYY